MTTTVSFHLPSYGTKQGNRFIAGGCCYCHLEQDALYKQFRLDEPWDGPNNSRLLPQMPECYVQPKKGLAPQPYHTCDKVFVGKGAAFEGKEGIRFPEEFLDGTGDTILVVENGEGVPWTKPDDLPYAPDQPLPKLDGIFPDGFFVAMADGSVRIIKKDTSEATLRALVTRNGGEKLGSDW